MKVAPSRLSNWLLVCGLLLTIVGGKLAVIDRFGSDVPQADQWFAEADYLLLPFEQGQLTAAALVRPNNEHRILFTRLLALGLFVANDQWDARLECAVNALLHATIAVAVFLWGRRTLAPHWHWPWLALVLATTGLPVAWENVLSAFDSQQDFLLGFSLVAIACLGAAEARTRRWWTGIACAVFEEFSMGSGMLAAASIGAVIVFQLRTRADLRRHAATLIACGAIIGLGVALQLSAIGPSRFLARGPSEFVFAFFRFLQWPFERLFWFRNARALVLLAPLAWAPWGWLAVRLWRNRTRAALSRVHAVQSVRPDLVSVPLPTSPVGLRRTGRREVTARTQGPALQPIGGLGEERNRGSTECLKCSERIAFAAGLWVLFHFAALAYSRGADAPWAASRYVDVIVVGVWVNALALAWWRSRSQMESPPRHQRIARAAALAGFACTVVGLGIHVTHIFEHELPEHRETLARSTATTRAFLASGNPAILHEGEIPHQYPDMFAQTLSQAEIKRILPASLQLEPRSPGPLSRAADYLTHHALFLVIAGFALLFAARIAGSRASGASVN